MRKANLPKNINVSEDTPSKRILLSIPFVHGAIAPLLATGIDAVVNVRVGVVPPDPDPMLVGQT